MVSGAACPLGTPPRTASGQLTWPAAPRRGSGFERIVQARAHFTLQRHDVERNREVANRVDAGCPRLEKLPGDMEGIAHAQSEPNMELASDGKLYESRVGDLSRDTALSRNDAVDLVE
jgi:hypothetical protein